MHSSANETATFLNIVLAAEIKAQTIQGLSALKQGRKIRLTDCEMSPRNPRGIQRIYWVWFVCLFFGLVKTGTPLFCWRMILPRTPYSEGKGDCIVQEPFPL